MVSWRKFIRLLKKYVFNDDDFCELIEEGIATGNLRCLCLKDLNLNGLDLRGVDMGSCDLCGADLRNVKFDGQTDVKYVIIDENTKIDEEFKAYIIAQKV